MKNGYCAFISDAKTGENGFLMMLDPNIKTLDDAMDALDSVAPMGAYKTLNLAQVEDGVCSMHWRDDDGALNDTGYVDGFAGGWFISSKSSDEVAAILDGMQAGHAMPEEAKKAMVALAKQMRIAMLEGIGYAGNKNLSDEERIERVQSAQRAERKAEIELRAMERMANMLGYGVSVLLNAPEVEPGIYVGGVRHWFRPFDEDGVVDDARNYKPLKGESLLDFVFGDSLVKPESAE